MRHRDVRRPTALILLVLLLVPWATGAQRAVAPPDLDPWVARVRDAFKVPGIAVAIVKDGVVVTSRGYGVRRLGAEGAVDGDTLFGIASNTKAFTTAAISILVDEGRLSWDDPVTKHLPSFAMYDPYVSREITLRDLVSHRAGLGLGAGDLMWWPPTDFSREEIVSGLRQVPPAVSFRSRYNYNNVLFVVAGEVIEAVTGVTWDAFVRERIFRPLGMNRSTTTIDALRLDPNAASPHALMDGRPQAMDAWAFDNAGAAASINSSANDLSKWAIVQLDAGVIRAPAAETNGAGGGERRLFSESMSREMWSPHIFQRIHDPHPALAALKPTWAAYGLGWGLADYRGRKVVSHTGALPGFLSRVALVPDEKLGVVVLTNQETGEAFQSVVLRVLDHYLGAPSTDWIAAYRQAQDKSLADAAAAARKDAAQRLGGTSPSLPIQQYAGRYRDRWYGDVMVEHADGRLVVRFTRTPLLVGDLEHWHHDTFAVRWRERVVDSDSLKGDAWLTFVLGHDGTVREATMDAISPRADFSFDYHDLRLTRLAH